MFVCFSVGNFKISERRNLFPERAFGATSAASLPATPDQRPQLVAVRRRVDATPTRQNFGRLEADAGGPQGLVQAQNCRTGMRRSVPGHRRTTGRFPERVDLVELSPPQRVVLNVRRPAEGDRPDQPLQLPATLQPQPLAHQVQQGQPRDDCRGLAAAGLAGHLVHVRDGHRVAGVVQRSAPKSFNVWTEASFRR